MGDWQTQIDELIELTYKDEKAAMQKASDLTLIAEETYGKASREYMSLVHRLGIMRMLTADYEQAESCFLEAMAAADGSEDIKPEELADIAKHLTMLYEAKARKAVK